jgi:chromosome segregation ATPase
MDAGSEDEEEVEALIKKRVKEGSGKEYDHIVRKELVAYKGKATHESDFQEFTKYEASRAYKAVCDYMEKADDPSTDLAKEIEALELQISRNEAKVTEMATQEATSEAMVVQAEAQIKEAGDTFVKVVEALKILEDLKDMLTEKSAEINEIAS